MKVRHAPFCPDGHFSHLTVSCKINSKISTRGILTARGYDFELSLVFSALGIATTRSVKKKRGGNFDEKLGKKLKEWSFLAEFRPPHGTYHTNLTIF